MLDHLRYLSSQPREISPEQFQRWRADPCTKELKRELVRVVLSELSQPLPETFDQTIITAHQREGAIKLVDELFTWEPKSVRDAREAGKEIAEDDDEA